MAISSRLDTARVLATVLLPTLAKGVIVRRPGAMALAGKLQSDGTAIDTMRHLRDRYGPEPVRLRITGRSVAVLVDPADVGRLLRESPEPFALATKEKKAALKHFQPHGVLISEGADRERRREQNERALRPENLTVEPIVRDEADLLLRHVMSTGELTWDAFAQAWWRIARRMMRRAEDAAQVHQGPPFSRTPDAQLIRVRSGANFLPWVFLHLRTSSAASVAVRVSGFSEKHALPAWMVARLIGKWKAFGVQLWTTSTSGSASRSR